MKQKLFILKKKVLVIELPRKADVEIFPNSIEIYNQFTGQEETIEGSYTLLGSPDDLKEEDLKDIVETKQYGSHPFFCTIDYSYEGNTFRPGFCSDDGKQFRRSFFSALEKEIYWENPFENKIDGFHGEHVDNGKIAAESRTFDRTLTLIFVEN